MSALVVVHPPAPGGGRRVTAHGETLGTAYGLTDLIEYLAGAGLDIATVDLYDDAVIEWQGGNHLVWGREAE
ncbi:hypothetical protein ACH4RA_16340 [Streptomyces smyrnaeus]|uniref:Uncharacterized protein n=1 Tax=Streptomyces smyrnaeus TaxID=1387713 RepID=A0ABS3XS19_9ACTN|nr:MULTISPECIES: hypothetical protein [Streptomyces]MBO8198185.1 hypothetical protein [Streptomyces smyrnaeus]MBQ0865008.1 hypothetical protein [Streptomyces sp. RK75]MBQ1123247.1 hypothetical protein [Streptomyces sp. B15]MBQ1161994.1 hypothetical protein [Streptomyces sp. A73]